jgi:hypothetical protein
VGTLDFNPSDQVFAENFYAVIRDFQSKQADFERRSKKLDAITDADEMGVPINADEKLAFRRDICEYMRSKIDGLFGTGTSEKVFGDALVIEIYLQFLEDVSPLIETARNEKMKRYLNKDLAGKVMK